MYYIREILYAFGLLAIGAIVGIFSPYQVRIKKIKPHTAKLIDKFEARGDTEMVDLIHKVEAGIPPEQIVAEMSPERRREYLEFVEAIEQIKQEGGKDGK